MLFILKYKEKDNESEKEKHEHKDEHENNLKEVLNAGGAKVNDELVSKVVSHCQGKNVLQVI